MPFSSTKVCQYLFLFLLVMITYSVGSGQAIDSTLANYVRENQQEIRLVDGQLLGSGADWLRQEANKAQFFFVGEEHDMRAVPNLLSALWPDLLRVGYKHVALEAGQWLGNRLDTYARFRDLNALSQFQQAALPRRPNISIPPSSDEDIRFYNVLAKHRPAGQKSAFIWGLDYEFKTTPLLQRLAALTPSQPKLHRQVNQVLNQVSTAEEAHQYSVQPFRNDILTILRSLDPRPGTEIQFIKDALLKRVGESTPAPDRSVIMKQLFLRAYRSAQRLGEPKPKVLLRFGSYHAKRGLMSDYGTSTLANFLGELAVSERTALLTLKIICCSPDERNSPGAPRPCTPSERVWLKPMQAGASNPWTLVNLLPLRESVKQGKLQLGPELFEVITGYDAVLLVKPYEPSTFSTGSIVR